MDLPESVEAAQNELGAIQQALGQVPQLQARLNFLAGWLSAQGQLPEPEPETNGDKPAPNRATRRAAKKKPAATSRVQARTRK